MDFISLFALAVGLSMDAFAVAICKGLSVRKVCWKHSLICGMYFGGFQALMPMIGYFLGKQFSDLITGIDHWLAFLLLVLIGCSMIRESKEQSDDLNPSFSPRTMLPLAIATSIDALAVGVTFAFLKVSLIPAVSLIGTITFLFGAFGVRIGNLFGMKLKSRAEIIGGILLIGMGLKILLEHTEFFRHF